jgi:hypothetical protein
VERCTRGETTSTQARHAGRDEFAATANALILMDCLTMDPFSLINSRIESDMGLLALVRTGRPSVVDGLHVDPGDFNSGESVGAVAGHGGWPVGVLVIRGRLSGRSKGIAAPSERLREGAAPSRARRCSSRSGERTRPGAAVEWRDTGRRRSTWNTDCDPVRVWDSRLARAHRLPPIPIPTLCRPRGRLQLAAAASPCPSRSR